MASWFANLAIATLVALPSVALATQWTVRDGYGWTIGYNYTNWVEEKVFHIGDSLLFNYPAGLHNVLKLSNVIDFQACKKPLENEALTSGHDVIPLKTTGVKWYICEVQDHCAIFNQKLKITVVDHTPSDKKSAANALISSGFKILVAAAIALVLVIA